MGLADSVGESPTLAAIATPTCSGWGRSQVRVPRPAD